MYVCIYVLVCVLSRYGERDRNKASKIPSNCSSYGNSKCVLEASRLPYDPADMYDLISTIVI